MKFLELGRSAVYLSLSYARHSYCCKPTNGEGFPRMIFSGATPPPACFQGFSVDKELLREKGQKAP
jgi:hypothetical protein